MLKINIAVCDSDEYYLKKIADYLLTKSSMFNVSEFTSLADLCGVLDTKAKMIDVLLVASEFTEILHRPDKIPFKAVLSDNTCTQDGEIAVINKYQRADKFVESLLMFLRKRQGVTNLFLNIVRNCKNLIMFRFDTLSDS